MAAVLPFIDHQFNGIIWRLEIDSLTDTLFAEIRNSEDKIVSFSSVNLLTAKINFSDLTTDERWLTGIEGTYNGVLLLHHYQSDNSPVHKGIIAIDGHTGTTVWSNYTYAFDHLSVNGPIIYNSQLQPKKLVLADIKTGTVIRNYEPAIDTEAVFPIIFPDVMPRSSYREPLLKIEPFGNSLHYVKLHNLRIVSLHAQTPKGLEQHLYVMDDAKVVFEDIMNTDIQKLQPEAFIVYKNCLIYIKNKFELKALNL
jgi:hypothetical protein